MNRAFLLVAMVAVLVAAAIPASALEFTGVSVGTWTRIDLPAEDIRYIEALQGENVLFWRDDPGATDILRRVAYTWDGTTVTLGAITSPTGLTSEIDHASILNNGGGSIEIYCQNQSIPSSVSLEHASSADNGATWSGQTTIAYPFPTPPGIGDSGTTGGGGIIEVGGQRRHYVQNNFGDIIMYTTTAGASGPMTNAGRLIDSYTSGTAPSGAAYSFQNQSPSGDAIMLPTGDVLYFYADGEGAEGTLGAVGVLLLDATGLAFTDVRDNFVNVTDAGFVASGMTRVDEITVGNITYSSNEMSFVLFICGDSTANGSMEDIAYAPVTITFDGSVAGAPAEVWVDGVAGDDGNDGSMGSPFATIQKGVNEVADGGTVHVAAGTYDGTVSIQKSVVISGNSKTDTFITYSGASEQIVFIGNNAGMVVGHVVIENFTLYPGPDLFGDMDLIKLRGSGTSSAEADMVIIQNNIFDGGVVTAKGIEESQHTAYFRVNNNEFNDCKYGMWLNQPSFAEITDNTFTNAKYASFAMCTSDFGVNGPHDVVITGNTILDNGTAAHGSVWSAGMHIGGTCYNVTISGNEIGNSTDYSIAVHDRGNTDLTNFHINNNSIYGSGMGSINETGVVIDCENNWWGDASGPSGVGPGTGDAVGIDIDYDPWLTSDPFAAAPTEVWVDGVTGDDANDGSMGSPFATIQKGVNTVAESGTVHVATAVYTENVRIAKDGLTIEGAGIDLSVIDLDGLVPHWDGPPGGGSYASRGGVLITGYGETDGEAEMVENVTFRGFTVQNAGANPPVTASGDHTGLDGAATLADSGASWVDDELIDEWVYNTADGSKGQIIDNDATTVTATLAGGAENDWDNGESYMILPYGEFLDPDSDGTDDLGGILVASARGTLIQNCKVQYSGAGGISSSRSPLGGKKLGESITIDGCTVSNNNETGITVNKYNKGPITITGNTVSNNLNPANPENHAKGMRVEGRNSSNMVSGLISGNTVSGNSYHGINIYKYTDTIIVENNTVTGHNLHEEGAGIFLNHWGSPQYCKNHIIRNNTVTGNIRGLIAYYAQESTFEGNTVTTVSGAFDPGQAAIKIDNANTITVENNTVSCDGLGIELTSDSNSCTITKNTVDGAMFAGVYVRSGAHDNTFTCNEITNTTSHTLTQYADWGAHDGGDGQPMLTDSGKAWGVNAFAGFTVVNLTDGSSGLIIANDGTTVTATLAGGAEDDWDDGDEYDIVYYETRAVGVFLRGGACYAAGHAGTGNVFNYNCIYANGGDGMENQTTTDVDAENNWWGSEDGPEDLSGSVEMPAGGDATPVADMLNAVAEASGSFDGSVTDNVDYFPWAEAPVYCGTDVVVVDDDWAPGGSDPKSTGDLVVVNGTSYIYDTNAFDTVQEGLDAVTNSIVYIGPGIYTATTGAIAVIDNPVTMIGSGQDGPNATIFDGGAYGAGQDTSGIGNGWTRAIVVRSSDVTIQDLRITNFQGDQVTVGGYGIVARGDNSWTGTGDQTFTGLLFQDITMEDAYYGVRMNRTDAAVLQRITYLVTTGAPDYGVYATSSPDVLLQESTFNQGSIWVADGSDNAQVLNNDVIDAPYNGIWVGLGFSLFANSDAPTISGNTINGCGEGGIVLWNNAAPAITGATIANNTITGAAGGSDDHGGISIYGGQYVDLDISGNDSSSNAGDQPGLSFTSNTVTSATVLGNTFSNNPGAGIRLYNVTRGTVSINNNTLDGNADGLTMAAGSASVLDAENNYWGSIDGPDDASGSVEMPAGGDATPVADMLNAVAEETGTLGDTVASNVDYFPWIYAPYYAGTDTIAVDDDWSAKSPGDLVYCPQSGLTHVFGTNAFATVAEALAAVTNSTIYVAGGNYSETITFGTGFAMDDLTISGDAGDRPVIDGGAWLQNTADISGLTLENLYLTGTAPGGTQFVIRMSNTGAVNNFTMDNCVIDGQSVSGRMGVDGNRFGQDFTMANNEFKDVLGWSLMDIHNGSGDGGSPLKFNTVTFANNHVHDCDGTVSLRGKAGDKTTVVNVYGNIVENIGGNEPGEAGQHWSAIEVNHAVALNLYGNTITNVSEGEWGEGQALQLWDIDTLDIHDNTLANNFEGIFIFGGGGVYGGPYDVPGGTIYDNDIAGNDQYGVRIGSGGNPGVLDCQGNWWGDATGPYDDADADGLNDNPGGLGDTIAPTGDDYVNHDGWATSPFGTWLRPEVAVVTREATSSGTFDVNVRLENVADLAAVLFDANDAPMSGPMVTASVVGAWWSGLAGSYFDSDWIPGGSGRRILGDIASGGVTGSGEISLLTIDYSGASDGTYTIALTYDELVDEMAGLIDHQVQDLTVVITAAAGPTDLQWVQVPVADSTTQISMEASATDPSGVEYQFYVDSVPQGWQSGGVFVDSGLSPNVQYSYEVEARDLTVEGNTSGPIGPETAYTLAAVPGVLALGPAGETTMDVNWTANGNPAPPDTEYQVHNTTLDSYSGWVTTLTWQDNLLTPNTSYAYEVRARNGDLIETVWAALGSKYTLAEEPVAAAFSDVTTTSIRANWVTSNNPAGTEYYCENETEGTNSGWTTDFTWNSTGLSPNTQYTFRVKARNAEGVETAWTGLGSIYTLATVPGGPVVNMTPMDLNGPSPKSLGIEYVPLNGNPADTEFAIKIVETGEFLVEHSGNAADVMPGAEASALWLTSAQWARRLRGLTYNTTYTLQSIARNGDGVQEIGGQSAYTTNVKGDVNRDGRCSGIDLIHVRNVINAGLGTIGVDYTWCVDVNDDRTLNGFDISYIRNTIFGRPTGD